MNHSIFVSAWLRGNEDLRSNVIVRGWEWEQGRRPVHLQGPGGTPRGHCWGRLRDPGTPTGYICIHALEVKIQSVWLLSERTFQQALDTKQSALSIL